jgi:type IV pilus assembly protein PilB
MAESSDDEAVRGIAEMAGLEYFPPRLIDTRRGELAHLLPESVARACNVILQPSNGTGVKLLMSNPLDFETIDRVRFHVGRPVILALASDRAIRESIERVYGKSG